MVGLSLQLPTNKASTGRKAALGLRQIAALMAPSASSLRSQPSCRQCDNFLHLLNGLTLPRQVASIVPTTTMAALAIIVRR
jgi:hypothetical protein